MGFLSIHTFLRACSPLLNGSEFIDGAGIIDDKFFFPLCEEKINAFYTYVMVKFGNF